MSKLLVSERSTEAKIKTASLKFEHRWWYENRVKCDLRIIIRKRDENILFYFLFIILYILLFITIFYFSICYKLSGSEHRLKQIENLERREKKSNNSRNKILLNKRIFLNLPCTKCEANRSTTFLLPHVRFSSLFHSSQLNLFPFSVLLFVRSPASYLEFLNAVLREIS